MLSNVKQATVVIATAAKSRAIRLRDGESIAFEAASSTTEGDLPERAIILLLLNFDHAGNHGRTAAHFA